MFGYLLQHTADYISRVLDIAYGGNSILDYIYVDGCNGSGGYCRPLRNLIGSLF